MSDIVVTVPVENIVRNPAALREVDTESVQFQELVDSVRLHGVLQPILVAPAGEGKYALIDGLHRLTAAVNAGRKDIKVTIEPIEQSEMLLTQIMMNIQRIDTKPVEYSKALERILATRPMMTVGELASKIGKSVQWFNDRLGLLKLDKKIGELVDDGKIKLGNAYQLAKLKPEEQQDFVERAMTLDPGEFAPAVQQFLKEKRAAAREGRAPKGPEAPTHAKLRPMIELTAALEDGSREISKLVKYTGITDPVEAVKLGIHYALQTDPISLDERKRKWEAQEAARAEAKAKRAAEAEARKQAKASEAMAALGA